MISPETKIYLSVSARPGRFGSAVYNTLFTELGIDALYIPRQAPDSAHDLISAIRTISLAGCSVSMPLKARVMPLLDSLDRSAQESCAVNTIVNRAGQLCGYNTDGAGVELALSTLPLRSVLVYGSGAVIGSIVAALRKLGITSISLVARNVEAARAACMRHGLTWAGNVEEISRQMPEYDLLINATPASLEKSPVQLLALVERARIVFDAVLSTTETNFIRHARLAGKQCVDGLQMYRGQVQRQFEIYTGIRPTLEQIDRAIQQSFLPSNSARTA